MGWSAVATIASTLFQYQQSNKAADQQTKYAYQQAEAQNKAAWDNYYSQVEQLGVQQNQITADATNEMSERAKQAAIEQARIRTASAEAGVAGLSVGSLLGDSAFQESIDRGGVLTNMQSRLIQNNYDNKGARANAISTSNQGYSNASATRLKAESSRMSPISAGLQIAGATGELGEKQGWWGSPKKVAPRKG